ncbi:MAG: phosphoserine phosphatase, partial [Alphaproteobacteria bacterium]|nr:phosphoserine phosphatase [Alphaproteobacteria bacterium]
HYQNQGEQVVFIGVGDNDVEAMRLADISIASGLTHHPAPSVLSIANYLTLNEEGLCRQLNQLL